MGRDQRRGWGPSGRTSGASYAFSRQNGDHGGSERADEEKRLSAANKGQPREEWIAKAYDAQGPALYRYALMIVADGALAEDVVQQAFARLLARRAEADVASLAGFLRVIVRNEAYRLLERRRPTETVADVADRLLEPVDDSAERHEEQRELERAMRQLSPEQREVMHLKFYEQLTFAAIAVLVGISQNTAASRYRYALARLRELMPTSRTGL